MISLEYFNDAEIVLNSSPGLNAKEIAQERSKHILAHQQGPTPVTSHP